MKRSYLLILMFALVLGILGGQAGAADLAIKVLSVDGAPYVGGTIDPSAHSVLIQIDLATWNFGTDVILGIAQSITFSPAATLATVTAWDPVNTGPTNCNGAFDIRGGVFFNENDPGGQYDATVSNAGCVTTFPLPFKLWQIELVPTGAEGTLTITAETDADQTYPPNPEYSVAHAAAGCTSPFLEDISGGDGILNIVFAPPPCRLNQTECPTGSVYANPYDNIIIDLTYAESGACNPPDLEYSITCDGGACPSEVTMDTNGDVVIAPYFSNLTEVCVSVEDTANPVACQQAGAVCECCFVLVPT